jgi:hypothetical protein
MDGPTDSILGAEAGANLFILQGYVGIDDDLGRGTLKRAILGLKAGGSIAGWNISGRGGGGYLVETNGILGGTKPTGDRSGPVARAGVAVDHDLAPGLALGFGVDGEYFALSSSGMSLSNNNLSDLALLESQIHTGFDVLGSLYLKFQLGI